MEGGRQERWSDDMVEMLTSYRRLLILLEIVVDES